MPEGAIYVGRPTKWGNQWRVVSFQRGGYGVTFKNYKNRTGAVYPLKQIALERIVELYEADVITSRLYEEINELRGKDLACWCALDQPCHADVLLRLANS